MSKMSVRGRRARLTQLLVTEGCIRVGELAETFGVTTETIRKDLIYLDEQGVVKKGHGNATASGGLLGRPLSERSVNNQNEKVVIAQRAVQMIPGNAVVILDAGSTTFNIAKLLLGREGLIIITNSMEIAQILSSSGNTVLSLGGEVSGINMSLTGMWAKTALKTIRADIAFLGTDGFAGRGGPCTTSYAEADIKHAMIESSTRTIVVGDSSKFSVSSLIEYGSWSEIDLFITDASAPEERIEALRRHAKIILAT